MKLYRFSDPLALPSYLCKEIFEVLHETPKGYWIKYWEVRGKKWVPKEGKNLFAFDTEEKALFNYRKRKKRQISILSNRIDYAKRCLEACDNEDYRVHPTGIESIYRGEG